MKAENISGMIGALLIIFAVSALVNVGMPTPILQWPIVAFVGIAFTFAWLTGAPSVLAYLITSLLVLLIGAAGYFIGRGLWRFTHR